MDCCRVSCANWLFESSCCIKSCVLLSATVTSVEALSINSSCDSSFCPRLRPEPVALFPSWTLANRSSRSFRLVASALRFACSWAFRNCIRALQEECQHLSISLPKSSSLTSSDPAPTVQPALLVRSDPFPSRYLCFEQQTSSSQYLCGPRSPDVTVQDPRLALLNFGESRH